MKVAMFSNYLNHHQLPFCQAMLELTAGDFVFVASTPVNSARLTIGYRDMNSEYPFVVRSYEDDVQYQEALRIAVNCDVMIFGSAPEEFINKRLSRRPGAVTFRYSERLFKSTAGKINWFSPFNHMAYIRSMIHRRRNYFLLAASAYAAVDYYRMGFGKKKYLKWGYFPDNTNLSLQEVFSKKTSKLRLIWVGRMIDLKHPEHAIEVAKMLRQADIDFEMVLVGDGELMPEIDKQIGAYGLQDRVVCTGGLPNDQVLEEMVKSHIHLFTSDWNEGWGAVLNEAMASACVPVASHAIGSVPFLIQDGKTGLIYKNGDISDLYEKVKQLAFDSALLNSMAEAAYNSVSVSWNAETAAERLYCISKELVAGNTVTNMYESGPCSSAELLKDNWRK